MLIVISNPAPVANEPAIINALFEEGLELLHLRKPMLAMDEVRILIDSIHPKYRHQIALHQYHELAMDAGINRLHFTGTKRTATGDNALMTLKTNNTILSTSIHDAETYCSLSPCFGYAFFGPVFNSISKQGYTSILPVDFVFPVQESKPAIIAIGGIDAANIQKVKGMQFNGAAVLGTIWKNVNDSVHQFKAVQKAWN